MSPACLYLSLFVIHSSPDCPVDDPYLCFWCPLFVLWLSRICALSLPECLSFVPWLSLKVFFLCFDCDLVYCNRPLIRLCWITVCLRGLLPDPRAKEGIEVEPLRCYSMFFSTLVADSWKTCEIVWISCLPWMALAQLPYSRALPLIIVQSLTRFFAYRNVV